MSKINNEEDNNYFWGINSNGLTKDLIESAKNDMKGKETVVSIDADSTDTIISKPNTNYNITSTNGVNDLSILLPATQGSEKQNIAFMLITGSNPNIGISVEDDTPIIYADGQTLESDKVYDINCSYDGDKWTISYTPLSAYTMFSDQNATMALLNATIRV